MLNRIRAVDRRGRCKLARVALTAVAPTCIRVEDAEGVLQGKPISDDLIGEASRSAAAYARPIDDVRASAEYRREMVAVIVARAVRRAVSRAQLVTR